jgi:hypothetical protein
MAETKNYTQDFGFGRRADARLNLSEAKLAFTEIEGEQIVNGRSVLARSWQK